jgi:uncharacterized protein YyaL (SSP411 family)
MAPTARSGGSGSASPIQWRPWGRAAFDEAVAGDRPVLLNLTAVWCVFCLQMEEETYADPARAATVNAEFVPVRVDVDRLPHVQERYIAGGWPTNAFLTPTGEVLWAGTYVGPDEFDEVARGVITAWNDRRGELRQEVQRRRKALEAARHRQPTTALVRREAAADVVSGMRHAFDARHGGFGEAPKFPYPDAVDLLLAEARITGDVAFLEMAEQTLDGILAGELWDDVDSGFYRYALGADWTAPRLEKLLDPNATLLRAFALGAAIRGRADWRGRAEEIVAWVEGTLRREDGLWAASQHADGEYWTLDAAGRRGRTPPAPDSTVYAASNAYWIRALAEAGARLGHPEWVERAAGALPLLLRRFAAPGGLLFHYQVPGQPPAVAGLLMDPLEAARACIMVAQASGRREFLDHALRLTAGMTATLWADHGGFYDHVRSEDDVAALALRDRPFEANSDAGRLLLDLHQVTGERGHRALAERIFATLSPLAGRYEIAGAAFALGVEEFFDPPRTVVLVGDPEATAALRHAAFRLPDADLRVWTLPKGGRIGGLAFPAQPAPAAYLCGRHGASAPLTDPGALAGAASR